MRCEDRVNGIGGCPAPVREEDIRCLYCGTFFADLRGVIMMEKMSKECFDTAVKEWSARDVLADFKYSLGLAFLPVVEKMVEAISYVST